MKPALSQNSPLRSPSTTPNTGLDPGMAVADNRWHETEVALVKLQGTDGRAPLRSVPAGSRPDLGEFGEHLASRFLVRHGLVILARNLRVGRGEIDLVVRDGSTVVAVEVRTASGTPYPLDAVDTTKRARVRSLASSIGVNRCDAIGVGVQHGFVVFHWDRDAF